MIFTHDVARATGPGRAGAASDGHLVSVETTPQPPRRPARTASAAGFPPVLPGAAHGHRHQEAKGVWSRSAALPLMSFVPARETAAFRTIVRNAGSGAAGFPGGNRRPLFLSEVPGLRWWRLTGPPAESVLPATRSGDCGREAGSGTHSQSHCTATTTLRAGPDSTPRMFRGRPLRPRSRPESPRS